MKQVRITVILHRDRLVYTVQSIERHKNGVDIVVYNGETEHGKKLQYDKIVKNIAKDGVSWENDIKSSLKSDFLKKLPSGLATYNSKNTKVLSEEKVFLGAWESL